MKMPSKIRLGSRNASATSGSPSQSDLNDRRARTLGADRSGRSNSRSLIAVYPVTTIGRAAWGRMSIHHQRCTSLSRAQQFLVSRVQHMTAIDLGTARAMLDFGLLYHDMALQARWRSR